MNPSQLIARARELNEKATTGPWSPDPEFSLIIESRTLVPALADALEEAMKDQLSPDARAVLEDQVDCDIADHSSVVLAMHATLTHWADVISSLLTERDTARAQVDTLAEALRKIGRCNCNAMCSYRESKNLCTICLARAALKEAGI